MNSTLSIIFFSIGLLIGITNWYAYLLATVKKRNTSFIPFIGCTLMLAGFFFGPYKQFWFLALILYFTALPMLIVVAIGKLRQGK
ncbi:hypothetical protein BTJ40_05095 [Microbulbifer sp. A4B17]|nr:hypothetical protein BTJ40_05095 [Microbulbifer sp. A4B17]